MIDDSDTYSIGMAVTTMQYCLTKSIGVGDGYDNQKDVCNGGSMGKRLGENYRRIRENYRLSTCILEVKGWAKITKVVRLEPTWGTQPPPLERKRTRPINRLI